MYTLIPTETFNLSYIKVIGKDQKKKKRTQKALHLLQQNPAYPSLKTHKVNTKTFGERWASWITGDLRIIWDFDEKQQLVILLLAITGHSGKHREYK